MATRYRPRHRPQINPNDPIGRFGCTAYSAAMAADYATLGGVQIEGYELRALTDEPVPDPKAPGLNIPQIREALDDLHIWTADRSGRVWTVLMSHLALRQAVILQGDRDQLHALPCPSSFLGSHAVLLTDERPGEILVYDPLCPTGPKWTPGGDVKRYGEKLGRQTGLVSGGMRFAVTRAIPLID